MKSDKSTQWLHIIDLDRFVTCNIIAHSFYLPCKVGCVNFTEMFRRTLGPSALNSERYLRKIGHITLICQCHFQLAQELFLKKFDFLDFL